MLLTPDAPVHEGDVIDGKYRVERVLGRGGMGIVVSAKHIELGTRVALKFLLPAHAANEDAVARFAREARASVRLRSDHTAKVHDVGRLEGGAPYIVMEFLTGEDLDAVLAARDSLPIAEAVGYILQACEAIAEAHSLGIIHRDLKPPNMFLTRKVGGATTLKVLDFGLAKTLEATESDHALTTSSSMLGSPAYMSPEQLRVVKDLDWRTDIWSLGVCLFELLTTELPFRAGTIAELCVNVLTLPARDVRDLRPEVPADLAAVLKRCLEKERSARFDSVGDLAAALEPFADETMRGAAARVDAILEATNPRDLTPSERGLPIAPAAVTPLRRDDPGVVTQSATSVDTKSSRRPRAYRRVAILVGLAVGGLASVVLFAGMGGTRTAPVAEAPRAPAADSATMIVAASSAPVASAPAGSSAAITPRDPPAASTAMAPRRPRPTPRLPPKPATVDPNPRGHM